MSILDTLNAIKQDGFDPTKDSIGGNANLESGDYPVKLNKSQVAVTRSGRTQIQIQLEVVSGDHKGRFETLFLGFESDLPDFVLENNGKYLMKIAALSDVQFTQGDLQTEEDTADALKRGIGKQFMMKLNVRPNKKNPDFPYRNYDFSPLQEETEESFPSSTTDFDGAADPFDGEIPF